MNIILFESLSPINELKSGDERFSHIVNILKLKVGDSFKCGVINSSSGIGTITKMSPSSITFQYEITKDKPDTPVKLTIIQGSVRPICLKRMLRAASECGVKEVILTEMELTEKSYLESGFIKNEEAYGTLLDGAIQSGTTYVPKLTILKSLDGVLKTFDDKDVLKIILDNKTTFYKSDVPNLNSNIVKDKDSVLLIGPERGFVDSERKMAINHGFTPYKLGNRILRAETAFITSLFPFITD